MEFSGEYYADYRELLLGLQVSGVIGSAVFNIMFVISVCGLCTSTVSKLNWWPLCRDCFFYAVSILVMLGTIYNESISW